MPNSQIDMVVGNDQVGWQVCGDVDVPQGRRVDIYVVVRQGDVIARGHQVVSTSPWQFPVVVEGGQLDAGQPDGPRKTAIASAVAITREDPSGLESFTWAQRIPVQSERQDEDSPPDFSDPGTVPDPNQPLEFGKSISSSLTITEPATARSAEDALAWKHALKIH